MTAKCLTALLKELAPKKRHVKALLLDVMEFICQELMVRMVGDEEVAAKLYRNTYGN